MIKHIAIDAGKAFTKGAMRKSDGTDKFVKFETAYDKAIGTGNVPAGHYVVELDGEEYLVGPSASNTSSGTTDKATLVHKLAAYCVLDQFCDNGDEVVVAIGAPISTTLSKEQVEKFKAYIFPTKQLTLKVKTADKGMSTKTITIKNVSVCAEGSGIINLDTRLQQVRCGVIDIGGKNINCCTFENSFSKTATAFTANFGAIKFKSDLRQAINNQFGTELTDATMNDVLKYGGVPTGNFNNPVRQDTVQFVSEYKQAFFDNIISQCKAKDWDIDYMYVVFVGGGSMLFGTEIAKAFGDRAVVYDDADMMNVAGFLKTIAG